MTSTDAAGSSDQEGTDGHDPARIQVLLDQTQSDSDRTLADGDQARSDRDQANADQDQQASDRDQATADREQDAAEGDSGEAYRAARDERRKGTDQRLAAATRRARTTSDRLGAANLRDLSARARDEAAADRDAAAEALEAAGPGASAEQRLAALRTKAGHDRTRAAADRAAAAADRAAAARDRARAATELRHAYHDQLTGALRREMGEVALQHELDRAHRGDGRLVLAFVDVDRLKALNDRDGHHAGDALLQAVVSVMRTRLRSFDPVVRYGGDEFICALAGADPADAAARFHDMQEELAREHDGAGISVGIVELKPGESLGDLIIRGDAALYDAKRRSRTTSVQAE